MTDHSEDYCRNYSKNLGNYVVYGVYTADIYSQLVM